MINCDEGLKEGRRHLDIKYVLRTALRWLVHLPSTPTSFSFVTLSITRTTLVDDLVNTRAPKTTPKKEHSQRGEAAEKWEDEWTKGQSDI